MDRFTVSQGCEVRLEYEGDQQNIIDHLDIKTFGSVYINDNQHGTITLTGTTLKVHSGGLVSDNFAFVSLYINISIWHSCHWFTLGFHTCFHNLLTLCCLFLLLF